MGHAKENAEFVSLNVSVLTVSDTRTEETDTSGHALVDRLKEAGHQLYAKAIVKDDVYQIRSILSQWVADSQTHVVLVTGGTGFTSRDSTPEAVTPLFDKVVEGYGELFRQKSALDIGSSTIQSRAVAGIANNTVIFCMPGSPNACKTAWDEIILEQLDARHRPCNFVAMVLAKVATESPVITASGTRS